MRSFKALLAVAALLGGQIAFAQTINTGTKVTVAAGTAIIGKVGIDQTTPGTTNGVVATGNVAHDGVDTGNPVKIGCRAQTGLRAEVASGDRVDATCTTQGAVAIGGAGSSGADGQTAITMLFNNGANLFPLGIAPFNYNGVTWDKAFTCPSTASVSVTAGNTTEIVALTASQVIRVCSIAVTMSAAGTAQFVYGTGSNCGTGTTSISAALALATATPLTLSATAGGSVMRTASANALCIAAVTGNVTGFITYAKF